MTPLAMVRLALLALVAVGLGVVGWWFFDGSTTRARTIRSRLTLVVETPEGERTGSSVTQSTISFPGGLTRAQGWAVWTTLVGEAVVVDLGPRGLLFSTFEMARHLAGGGLDLYNADLMPFPDAKFPGKVQDGMSTNDKMAAYLDEVNRLKPKGELSVSDIPVLIKFRDPNDPTSAEIVDPRNLAASFGQGVALKGAFIEITDDPVTEGIEARLPWLASSKSSPTLFPPPDPREGLHTVSETPPVKYLRYDDFRRLAQ